MSRTAVKRSLQPAKAPKVLRRRLEEIWRRLLRLNFLSSCLAVLTFLVLVPNLAFAQTPVAVLTISPTSVQLGESVSFEWVCPNELMPWQPFPLPFIYAQITVNRMQEFPTSIPPYLSPFLPPAGTLSYSPPTQGTFTVILRCHYYGASIDLGDFSCSSIACKTGGLFVVTAPTGGSVP